VSEENGRGLEKYFILNAVESCFKWGRNYFKVYHLEPGASGSHLYPRYLGD
jgi:hypothetical protein